jgi:hypothetical protein
MQVAIQKKDIQQHEELLETLNNKRTNGSGSMAKVDTSSRVPFPVIGKVEASIVTLKAIYAELVAESLFLVPLRYYTLGGIVDP